MKRDEVSVVVTGLGCVSPAGVGVDALWSTARGGRAQGELLLEIDVKMNRSRIAARVPKLSAGQIFSEAGQERDPVTTYALLAAREAWDDAGLSKYPFEASRVGVSVGTGVGGVQTMEESFRKSVVFLCDQKPEYIRLQPAADHGRLFNGFLASSAASTVAKALGAEGFTVCVATGCTAGIDSIGSAFDLIVSGVCDVVIAGASEAPITPIVVTAFDNIHCLSRRNDSPKTASRPFDRDRDGFLLAEGCGILILESLQHAIRRRARIYGAVLGYASVSSAYHMTGLEEDGKTQSDAIGKALTKARVNKEEVDYINAHGTSTPQNDISETNAIKLALGDRSKDILVSSTKSVIGHALGAASALASIVCFRAINEGIVPPTANYFERDPQCDLNYVPNIAVESDIKIAVCNASGFSGIHTSTVYSSF